MLRKAAQEFGKKKCPKSFVRAMEKDEKGFSPELWKEMAELGWMGCCFPEEYGGIGGSFVDLIVLLEEFGRALLPSPFLPTVVHCGFPILFAGTEEQKREFLPKIASGELIRIIPDTRILTVAPPCVILAETRDDHFCDGVGAGPAHRSPLIEKIAPANLLHVSADVVHALHFALQQGTP